MTIYGLIAQPAMHSLSPVMQNRMIAARQIDAYYQAFDVAPEQLGAAVAGLRVLSVGGFNVSTPHKSTIIPYLDELTPQAQRLQAVNTVKNIKGHLIGTSTDGSQGIGQLADLADNQTLSAALQQADLLINATTVGMNDARTLLTDYQIGLLPQHTLVVDMIYRNQQTGLLRAAASRQLPTQNGLAMLVNQGALSFEYWFNQPADRQLMAETIRGITI